MTSFLAESGVIAVFVLMLIDAVLPAASELSMGYGGALASGALGHKLSVFGHHETGLKAYLAVVAAGLVGYQLGSIGGWLVGIRGGRPLLERHGKWFHLSPDKLDRAERWFARFGDGATFVGRFTPVARSFISIPAGVFEQPFVRYNVLTLLGNAVWCFAIAGIGWGLGSSYEHFHHAFEYVELAIAVLIVAALAVWLWRRRSSTMDRRGDPAR